MFNAIQNLSSSVEWVSDQDDIEPQPVEAEEEQPVYFKAEANPFVQDVKASQVTTQAGRFRTEAEREASEDVEDPLAPAPSSLEEERTEEVAEVTTAPVETAELFAIKNGRFLVRFDRYDPAKLDEAFKSVAEALSMNGMDPKKMYAVGAVHGDITAADEISMEKVTPEITGLFKNVAIQAYSDLGIGSMLRTEESYPPFSVIISRAPIPLYDSNETMDLGSSKIGGIISDSRYYCELGAGNDLRQVEKMVSEWIDRKKPAPDNVFSLKKDEQVVDTGYVWQDLLESVDVSTNEAGELEIYVSPKKGVSLEGVMGFFEDLQPELQKIPCTQSGKITVKMKIPRWPDYTDFQERIETAMKDTFESKTISVKTEFEVDDMLQLNVILSPFLIKEGDLNGVVMAPPYPFVEIRSEAMRSVIQDHEDMVGKIAANRLKNDDYQMVLVYDIPFGSINMDSREASREFHNMIKYNEMRKHERLQLEEKAQKLADEIKALDDRIRSKNLIIQKEERRSAVLQRQREKYIKKGDATSLPKIDKEMEMVRSRIKTAEEENRPYIEQLNELANKEKRMAPYLAKARDFSQFPDTSVLGLVASTERPKLNGIRKPHLNSLFVPLDLSVEGWDQRDDYVAEFKNDKQVEFKFRTFRDVRDAILDEGTDPYVRTKAHYLLKYLYSNIRRTRYWQDIASGIFSGK